MSGGRTDEPWMRAWEAFLVAHRRLVDRLGAELAAEQGLSLTSYDVLVNLAAAENGRQRMVDLAQSVVLTPSGLTRLVDRLESGGLVQRERCETDKRSWYVVLTPEGRARLLAAAPVHLRGVEEHFASHLSEAEAEIIAATLSRVTGAVTDPTADLV
jgi:DNA-binding MarR family transcriptional regulator